MKKVLKLPYLPIILTPIILFSPFIFGGKALFWGTPSLQFVPWWDWAWETIRNGYLPLWNPLVGMGAPFIANYQSALFYPPIWSYFLLHWVGGAPLMAWGQALFISFHLIVAGMGMAFLIRRLGGSDLSQTIGGVSFSLSGYLVARAGFLSIIATAAWLPWMMAYAYLLSHKGSFSRFSKLSLIIALQLLAGHAQTAYYSIILMVVWGSYWSWADKKELEWENKIRQTAVHVGYILAACLAASWAAAVQLIPTAEYLTQSQRATSVDYDFAMNYSFWPWRILTLFAPDIFGDPSLGNYWGYGNYWEDAIYIGFIPILLALGLMVKSAYQRIRAKAGNQPEKENGYPAYPLFLLVIVLVSFLLALGKNTPIFPWLYHHVPTFDLFQAPTRINIWAVFALSLLAGIGADHWHRPTGRSLYWTRLATAGAVAVVIGAGLAWILLNSVKLTFIRATAFVGLWGLGAGALSLLAPQDKQSPEMPVWWKWGVIVWVVADLLVAGWGLNPGVEMDFYREEFKSAEKEERLYLPAQEEYEIKYERFFKFETFQPSFDWEKLRKSSLPNLNMLDDLASVNNFDPLVPGRYQMWMDSLVETNPEQRDILLDLMGVGSIGKQINGGIVKYQNLPRESSLYRWLPCARAADSPQNALKFVMGGEVDLGKWVLIEEKPSQAQGSCQGLVRDIEVVEKTPNREVLHVQAGSTGWLLRSTVWYPGWTSFVDGEEIPLYRGDYLFQAVHVPEGEHEVVFSYQPMSVFVGGALSLAAVLVWIGTCIGRKRWKRD